MYPSIESALNTNRVEVLQVVKNVAGTGNDAIFAKKDRCELTFCVVKFADGTFVNTTIYDEEIFEAIETEFNAACDQAHFDRSCMS